MLRWESERDTSKEIEWGRFIKQDEITHVSSRHDLLTSEKKWMVYFQNRRHSSESAPENDGWTFLLVNFETMQLFEIAEKAEILKDKQLCGKAVFWFQYKGMHRPIVAYACDLENKKCYSLLDRQAPLMSYPIICEVGQDSYFVPFQQSHQNGKIYHFNKLDLKWRSIQTREYEKINCLRQGVIKNQKIYFAAKAKKGESIVCLDLNSFKWTRLPFTNFKSEGCTQLASCAGSNFIYVMYSSYDLHTYIYKFNVSNHRMERVFAQGEVENLWPYDCITLGNRIINLAPLRYTCTDTPSERTISMNWNFHVLNTDTTLKDLAMAVVVEKKLNTDGLPKGLQEEIKRVYKLQFILKTEKK